MDDDYDDDDDDDGGGNFDQDDLDVKNYSQYDGLNAQNSQLAVVQMTK